MEREIYTDAVGGDPEEGREMWVYEDFDLARVAESLGCFGIRVEQPGDIQPALQKALDSNRPAVVDVVGDLEVMAPLGWSP